MKTIDHSLEGRGPLFALMARLQSIGTRDPEFASVLMDSVRQRAFAANGDTA